MEAHTPVPENDQAAPVQEGASVPSTSDERASINNIMRHAYRPLSDVEKNHMLRLKDAGLAFFELCDHIGSSRELSLAKTKIEEAVMWGVKHVTK